MIESKSNTKADEFRNEGNKHFKRWQFLEALECYNESLCFAEPASQQISLAYANRSAVYLEAKLYQKCLDNIELARKHGYQKPEKLKEREEKCKDLMKSHVEDQDENPSNFFKLSYPANEKLPFIINCVELRENNKYGRYIVTNTELKTGDIIAIEEPYVCSINSSSIFKRCYNCNKHNMLSLIPSVVSCKPPCTSKMFCSEYCRDDHENVPHRMQCALGRIEDYTANHCLLAVKLVVKHVKIAGSVAKLRALASDSTPRTVFDFDLSNREDPMYQMNMLLLTNSLARKSMLFEDVILRLSKEFFFDNEPFKSMEGKDRDFIFEYLRKQAAVISTNHFTGCPTHDNDDYLGFGVFPFTSLFSHSCDPNIKAVDIDNKVCLYAARPIPAGEQLFISYGCTFFSYTRAERHQVLAKYKFKCDCIACLQNYPPHYQLQRKDPYYNLSVKGIKTVSDAVSDLQECTRYIEKNFKHHPSLETMATERYLSQCMKEMSKIRVDYR